MWQDPISIEDNFKEEEENSLDITWQDDILKDPLSIKDNVKEEERTSLDIKWHDGILKDPLSIEDEGEYIIEGKPHYCTYDFSIKPHFGLLAGLTVGWSIYIL